MSSLERIEKLEDQTDSLEAPDHCVFCYKPNMFWYQLIQIAYQKKIGKKVEHSEPCIHHKDSWLLWTVDAANFIFGSFRDIAKNKKYGFVIDTIQDQTKMKKQLKEFITLIEKWSPWWDMYCEDNKRVREGKPKKYNYMEDLDDAVDIEKEKVLKLRTLEYEKALEIIQYFK